VRGGLQKFDPESQASVSSALEIRMKQTERRGDLLISVEVAPLSALSRSAPERIKIFFDAHRFIIPFRTRRFRALLHSCGKEPSHAVRDSRFPQSTTSCARRERFVRSRVGEVGASVWRTKMEIYAHMEVVDTNDQHVGTVETVEGDRIKLMNDDALDPKQLYIDKSRVAKVDANKVYLSQHVSAITTRAFLSSE
jgi:hypothetical protein